MPLPPFARFVALACLSLAVAPCCAAAAAKTDAQVLADLNRVIPGLNMNGVALSDVIDFVRDVSGDSIVVDWPALEKAGIKQDVPVTANMQGVTLSAALTTILDKVSAKPGQLTYTVKGGAIHIAPK